MKRIDRIRRTLAFTAVLILAGAAAHAQVQLDDRCTISVLNRTAQVRSDGTWTISDVPSNLGLVRARATCQQNGVTYEGVSDYFIVPTNGVIGVQNIVFTVPQPVPASLRLTAARTTLTNIGDTTQLTAVVTYANGTTKNVSTDLDGTTYTTSNPSVATVSAKGVLTAVGVGTVIIGAQNEGALGLARVAVSTSILDSDKDGMPDDWELANGLNPNDPSDANQDLDGDGLTNLQEYQLGTNPRVRDSDGDGVSDGLEVQTGSDPLDPRSVNLAAALSGIAVAPNPIPIVLDTLLGQGSRAVTITGNLIDGSTIDLTRGRGTTYTVNNPSLAQATSDGVITAFATGSTSVLVSNGTWSVLVPINITGFTPRVVTTLQLFTPTNEIALAGSNCFLAAGNSGLQVVSVATPESPRLIGSLPSRGSSYAVRVSGNTAYIADAQGGLTIADVSVPAAPQLAGSVALPGTAMGVAVSNGIAYLACAAGGLQIVDVSTPATAHVVGSLAVGNAATVDADGTLVAVGLADGHVVLVDAANPAAPVQLASLTTKIPRDVRLRGTALYVGALENGLTVYDVTKPALPRPVGATTVLMQMDGLAPLGGFVFGADGFGGGGVTVNDVRDPSAPFTRARIASGGATNAVAADRRYCYSANSFSVIKPQGSGSSSFVVGQYLATSDSGTTAPTVAIASPAEGSAVMEGTTVQVTVNASDDVAVSEVDLSINSRRVGAANSAPYLIPVRIPSGVSAVTIDAKAFDFAGNAGTASVHLQVTHDATPPAVSIVPPAKLVAGTSATVTVQASDDVAIDRVDFSFNGQPVGTIWKSPYTFTFLVPPGTTSAAMTAVATDMAGNTNTATLNAPVQQDFPPTVNLVSPPATATLYPGSDVRVIVDATDDIKISSLTVLLNGTSMRASFDNRTFYSFNALPLTATAATIEVTATDSIGQKTKVTRTLPIQPTSALGAVTIPGFANHVELSGGYALIAAGAGGLQVVDVRTPASPAIVASVALPGNANRILLDGQYAFVSTGAAGVQVADVHDPLNPVLAGSATTDGIAVHLARYRDRLFVGTDLGFDIFDVRNPRVPRRTGFVPWPKRIDDVSVDGNVLGVIARSEVEDNSVCSYRCSRLRLYDLADPDNPALLSSSALLDVGDFESLKLSPGRAHLGSVDYYYEFDITNPAAPTLLGSFDPLGIRYGYHEIQVVSPKQVFIAKDEFGYFNTMNVLDTSDLGNMFLAGGIDFGGFGNYFGTGIRVTPDLVFTTGAANRLNAAYGTDAATNGISKLFIGRYATVSDTGGVAPTVTASSPLTSAYDHQSVPLSVTATDDVAVASVSVSVDGTVVGTRRTPPYEFLVELPSAGAHTIVATAADTAGNVGQSSPLTVTGVNDTSAPSVTLVDPPEGETVPGNGVHILAAASDAFSVARVEIIVNGTVMATLTAPPYDYEYTLPAGMTSITVVARAYDVAGNSNSTPPRTVNFVAPQLLAAVPVPGFANEVDVNGDYAFVAAASAGLLVYDLSTPASPQLAATLPLGGVAWGLRLHGQYAYVSVDGKVQVIDISDPRQPRVAFTTGLTAYAISGYGTHLYTSNGASVSVDNLVPSSGAQNAFTFVFGDTAFGRIDAEKDRAIVSVRDTYFGSTSIYAFDARALTYRWFSLDLNRATAYNLRSKDNYLAIATSRGLYFTDVAARFDWSATVLPTTAFRAVDHHDRYAAAGVDVVPAQAVLFDITNHKQPVVRGTISFAPYGSFKPGTMAVTPTLLVMTAWDPNTTSAYPSSIGTSQLFIARYRTIVDSGTQPPSVTLEVPATVAPNSYLPMIAHATDDVGLKSVTFIVNGVDAYTDTVAPYTFNYSVGNAATVRVQVRATDYAGNSSLSTSYLVNVQ